MSTRHVSILCTVLLIAAAARADTLLVNAEGTGDYATVQAAIGAAPWNSVIELAPGTYTGEGNRDIHLHGKPLTIRGLAADPSACVIDCEGSANDPHRAFIFDWSEGPGSVIQALTITHGYATGTDPPDLESCGGAILIGDYASPTFIDVAVRDCTAKDGGGVAAGLHANPTFLRCAFTGNTAWWGGGGGVWLFQASALLTDCHFVENRGFQVGGGLEGIDPESLVITGCLFKDNAVESGYGAGASVGQGTVEISHSTFVGNHGAGAVTGAGLEFLQVSSASVDVCTFVGNIADHGAAISAGYGSLVTVANSLIAGNEGGGALYCDGGLFELSCSDIWGNVNGDWTGCIAGQEGFDGNISLDPLFCDAAGGDLTLDADSPCAPEANPDCGLIGAWPVGCGITGVEMSTPLGDLALSVAPNPMSGSCQVSLRPPTAGSLTVEVVDVRGHVVRRLHEGPAPAAKDGGLTLPWDGRDATGRRLASGIYWLRASGAVGHEARRVVIVR